MNVSAEVNAKLPEEETIKLKKKIINLALLLSPAASGMKPPMPAADTVDRCLAMVQVNAAQLGPPIPPAGLWGTLVQVLYKYNDLRQKL